MLLCLTTYCFIGFNSCQKESFPDSNYESEFLESTEPMLREDNVFGDIEFPDPDCNCCVRILDQSINISPLPPSFVINIQAAGGDNCEATPNTSCPYFSGVFGSQACVSSVFGDDDSNCNQTLDLSTGGCMPSNCTPSIAQFFAFVIPVDENCNEITVLETMEFSFTLEIECNPDPLGPDCINVDDDGSGSTQPPLVNTTIITLTNVDNNIAVETPPIPFGDPNNCCQFSTGVSGD